MVFEVLASQHAGSGPGTRETDLVPVDVTSDELAAAAIARIAPSSQSAKWSPWEPCPESVTCRYLNSSAEPHAQEVCIMGTHGAVEGTGDLSVPPCRPRRLYHVT